MKFDGWETSGENHKSVYYWIRYRLGEPIPKNMKFEGWQKSKIGYGRDKPIHYWIVYRLGEPIPEDMKYPGW